MTHLTESVGTRVKCERCGFDGWTSEEFGHVCRVFVYLHEYEQLKTLDRRLGELRIKYGALPNETLEEWIGRLADQVKKATELSQEIHDYLKKRDDERHGLIGNLRCIFDHVLRDVKVPR